MMRILHRFVVWLFGRPVTDIRHDCGAYLEDVGADSTGVLHTYYCPECRETVHSVLGGPVQ